MSARSDWERISSKNTLTEPFLHTSTENLEYSLNTLSQNYHDLRANLTKLNQLQRDAKSTNDAQRLQTQHTLVSNKLRHLLDTMNNIGRNQVKLSKSQRESFKRAKEQFLSVESEISKGLHESLQTVKRLKSQRLMDLDQREELTVEMSQMPQHLIDEEENLIDDEYMEEEEEQIQKKPLLEEYVHNAIEAEKKIRDEKIEDLKILEREMDQLMEGFVNLRTTVVSQQGNIDAVQDHVQKSNVNVEKSISSMKSATAAQKQGNKIIYTTVCLMVLVTLVCAVALLAMFYIKQAS